MNEIFHLSLDGTITSLYAPELRFVATGTSLREKRIKITGTIDDMPISIIQASGCIPSRDDSIIEIKEENFSFIIAWKDVDNDILNSAWDKLKDFLSIPIFPFDSKMIKLKFDGVDFPLTTSFHVELHHSITRYTKDTINLQHVFTEGIRSPSHMGGICESGESFRMHIHYKAFDALRRIANPILTMISVLYLDLTAMLAGGMNWRNNPAVVFGLLSINTAAFASLAAIRVGSTTKSFINLVRMIAVVWIVILTLTIRTSGIPNIEYIIDIGLKGCIALIVVLILFSFLPYSFEKSPKKRKNMFYLLLWIGVIAWIAACYMTDHVNAAIIFSNAVNKNI